MWTPRISVQEGGESVTVLVDQRPYMRYRRTDALAQRWALVQLHEVGVATQEELAAAFHLHVKSVYNALSAFRTEGSGGLCPERRGPRGAWKVTPTRRGKILAVAFERRTVNVEAITAALKEEWHEDISTFSVGAVLRENGLAAVMPSAVGALATGLVWEPVGGQLTLPWGEPTPSSEPPPVPATGETFTPERSRQRPLARYSQAERLYLAQLREGFFNPVGGGLLYVPFVTRAHYVDTVCVAVDEGTEGYTREQLALTLLYMHVFRIRSVEALKGIAPDDLGLLIGRLTSPSRWTIRRFLGAVAEHGRTEAIVQTVTKTWLRLGFVTPTPLYLDGHFMPYYGQQVIAKGYWPQRQMGLKGSELFMAVDTHFWPVFWTLTSCQTDLTQAIPTLLATLQALATEAGVPAEPLTVVFDREGYSGPLFRTLDDLKVTFITWAKYAARWVDDLPADQFTAEMTLPYEVQPADTIRYFETTRPMSKYGAIRTIVIESRRRQRRAAIFTNDTSRSPATIIQLIGRRWGEENWFSVMKHAFRLDYMPGHDAEELTEQPVVDNPQREALQHSRATLTARLREAQIQLAQQVVQAAQRGAWADLNATSLARRAEIVEVETALRQLKETSDALPAQVPFAEAHGAPLSAFEYHRKRFMDLTKIFVYLLEKHLCEVLAPGYVDRKRDLWPTLHTIVRRGAWVHLEGETVTVRLRRFWEPAVQEAAQHLCARVTAMGPKTLDKFGFSLRYEVE